MTEAEQHISRLDERRAWLSKLIQEGRARGRDVSYQESERDALDWILLKVKAQLASGR